MINQTDLESGLRKSGLEKGDVVLLHSSFKSFGDVEGGPQTVVNAFLSVLGKEGTLIVPTFNFDFSSTGKPWNVKTTPSHMGVISEFVRKNDQSNRILHPIYSFSIIGNLANELGSLRYKSSYGADSLFAKLRELNGKIMQIDSVNKGTTFFLHVEEMEGCNYRYLKEFTGKITDETGRTYEDKFLINVRDLSKGVITNVKTIGDILIDDGISKVNKIGDATVWTMKSDDVYKRIALEMKNNPYILCHIGKKLVGKVALVTGASRGIGKAIATLFAQEGASLMLTSKDEKTLKQTSKELGEYNDYDVHFASADIRNEDEVRDVINKTVEKFGRIDILVNNAGIFPKLKPLHEIPESEWNEIIDVNLTGQFRFTKAVIPFMQKKGGSIINISSDAGLKAFENFEGDAYSASKAALIHLTKVWALEYAKNQIRVNCVCAAVVDTDMTKSLWLSSESHRHKTASEHPLGRVGTTLDIAKAVFYYASDDSSWTTGSILTVDGGVSIK
jgi:NAD(P)-dependent dehydrogenase (short-subunit alcohol dehydrogenase family)/aminoglycoside N3'-acetyltransferase